MERKVTCIDCGRRVLYYNAVPDVMNGKRVYLCNQCAFAGATGLTPRLANPLVKKTKTIYWINDYEKPPKIGEIFTDSKGNQCLVVNRIGRLLYIKDANDFKHSFNPFVKFDKHSRDSVISAAIKMATRTKRAMYVFTQEGVFAVSESKPEASSYYKITRDGRVMQISPAMAFNPKQKRNNPQTFYKSKSNSKSLYEKFHGANPARVRSIEVDIPPAGTKLVKLGMLESVIYQPESPSKLAGRHFEHKFGDYGYKFEGKNKPILASSQDGSHLFILKSNSRFKFGERGIVG